MQSANQPHVPHSLISSGIDWITATAQKPDTRIDMMQYARHERDRLMDSGATIKSGYRLGYFGWEAEGFFHGQREGSSIIVASGEVADRVWLPAFRVADNVARLDLQVTLATPIDRPHLGVQAYQALKSGSPRKVHAKNVTLITSQPEGETCSIGKRSSDSYGRLYDKATESKLGEARSAWRYEVELKRTVALRYATALSSHHSHQAATTLLVHEWFDARGVAPVFTPDPTFCPQKPGQTKATRNILIWFEESLSITVARAVKRYGAERVVEALGLSGQVDVKPRKGE
jgi:hypothetical protein